LKKKRDPSSSSIPWARGLIAPSLLSADFSKLGHELGEISSADWAHLDVMDGHFVPNLTLGPPLVQSLRSVTSLPLDCHLMVSRPEDWIDPFFEAGADILTVHMEATVHLHRLVHRILDKGMKAGVALNPGTSLRTLESILDDVDLVLLMSVNPGFGGQSFIDNALGRVRELVELRERANASFLIQIDGGVSSQNASALWAAGADVLVAGSAVFGAPRRNQTPAQAIESLRPSQ